MTQETVQHNDLLEDVIDNLMSRDDQASVVAAAMLGACMDDGDLNKAIEVKEVEIKIVAAANQAAATIKEAFQSVVEDNKERDLKKWNRIDCSGVTGRQVPLNPDNVVTVDSDDVVVEQGSKVVLIKTEEVWLTNPEDGQIQTKLTGRSYIREASESESTAIQNQLLVDGIAETALRKMFQ